MIATVRLPRLSQNFLTAVVAENGFVKESNELSQMIIGAITASEGFSGIPNRDDSSRALQYNEVYVFSAFGIGEHIMKYKLSRFFFCLILFFLSSKQISVLISYTPPFWFSESNQP